MYVCVYIYKSIFYALARRLNQAKSWLELMDLGGAVQGWWVWAGAWGAEWCAGTSLRIIRWWNTVEE